MTDKHFRQTLRDTARDAIPDSFDRRSQILSRAQAQSPRVRWSASLRLSPRRIALVLLIALTSTVAYGVYQVTRPIGDPGLVGVQQAGYITDLNLAQVVDGIEMQLDWAYIDEGRAVLNYQTFIVHDDGRREPTDADMPFNARLIERAGRLPDLTPSRFNGSTAPEPITMMFYLPQTAEPHALPGSVDLRFEIVFESRPGIRTPLERFLSGGRSTNSVFFGGIESSGMTSAAAEVGVSSSQIIIGGFATEEAEATREPLPAGFGPFVFDFTLPILHAVNVQPLQAVTANGVTMTLENVTVSPSKTDLRFCFIQPEGKQWWQGESEILVGETSAAPRGSEGNVGDDGRACTQTYFEFYATLPATLTYTIRAIERHPESPDEFRMAQRELNARGIPMDLEFAPDGTVASYSWPIGLEEAKPALVELGFRIVGPWVFTVEIPPLGGGD